MIETSTTSPLPLVIAAGLVIALVALWLSARSALTVCVLGIEKGHVSVRRGAIAPRVLADIADVVGRPPVARAAVRILRRRGHAEIEIRGSVPPDQRQRLFNVVGSLPLAKLANGRRRR